MTPSARIIKGFKRMGIRSSHQPVNRFAVACSEAASGILFLVLLLPATHGAAQRTNPAASDVFQQVQSLVQQGRLQEAKSSTIDLLKKYPSSVEGHNLLGIIDANQQDYAGAIAAFKKALQIAPRSAKTHNNLGNIYVAEKQVALAEAEFRTVLRLEPGNQDANYNLGVLLMMKGAPAEAIPHFEHVHPSNAATQFNLIRAYFEVKRPADALRTATELSAAAQSDVQVHFSLGVLLASEKQYKPAQLELEKANALRPETFEILYNLGQVLLRNGEYARSELALRRALSLQPDSVETMYLLAQALTDESRPLDALDLLIKAHNLAPKNADIIFLMAQVSMSQNYYEDAIPLLESGIQIAPQRADLHAALGESYFMAGKIDKAIEEFKQLLALEHSARSLAFLGLSYRNLGRFDEAKSYFEQGLKLDPRNTLCIYNLGYIAERQGDSATADAQFQKALNINPDFPDAILELANLRIVQHRLPEAETLLRKYVQVSHDPATGYYKLAMVERTLHEMDAAERDLKVFKTLSKNATDGPYPYQHLFDYLDNRSRLAPGARNQLDLTELDAEVKRHPEQPQNLYLLAQAYLKSGDVENAMKTIASLDKISAGDYRTLTGTGVLLARYHYYDAAIQHFEAALQANPNSDDVKFNLANAYFKKRQYQQALDIANQVSPDGRKDNAYLNLLGDIYLHSDDTAHAIAIFEDAIQRNPDDDQGYLSLALVQFRQNQAAAAQATLLKGQARIPGSGKLYWGLGLAFMLQGDTSKAAQLFEHTIELLPEWSGGYATLGVFYFETGQIDKARDVLNRFKNSSVSGSLDMNRIEEVLDRAPATPARANEPMSMANRMQLLQLAYSLADRTL